MRTMIVILATFSATMIPAQAMTVTARVSGGNIAVHAGPHASTPVLAHLADGTEIPIDT